MAWYDVVWCGMVWSDVQWYGMGLGHVWHDKVCHDMAAVRYAMLWYSIVKYGKAKIVASMTEYRPLGQEILTKRLAVCYTMHYTLYIICSFQNAI